MNKTLNRVLVTGATGKIGHYLLPALASKVTVRAFSRTAALEEFADKIEIAKGDFGDVDAFERALENVDAVFLLWPFLDAGQAKPIVEAIARSGVTLVYLSSAGAGDPIDRAANPISRSLYEIEQLIEVSVSKWTILRPTAFASNTAVFWSSQIRATGTVRWALPTTQLAVIHDGDIAAVIARVLLSGSYSGQRLLLTGPTTLTPVEELEAISEAIGRPLYFEEITVDAAHAQMLGWGVPEEIVGGVHGYWARRVSDPEPVTDTVEQVTGHKARTFQIWASENAAKFE
jgi:uncharacterized protein YbjT (DUF2867 family)